MSDNKELARFDFTSSNPGWEVISPDMMVGIRSAAMLAHRMAFKFENNQFLGLFAEVIIFSEVSKRQEVHIIQVDQNFEANVRKIQYGE